MGKFIIKYEVFDEYVGVAEDDSSWVPFVKDADKARVFNSEEDSQKDINKQPKIVRPLYHIEEI